MATITDELELIRRKNRGLLRPVDVVQFARNPRTALHARFTWDDSEAAEQYRLWQARQVIRVTVGIVPGTETTNRIFVSMKADRYEEAGGYRAMVDMLSDESSRALLLEEALDELDGFRRKYKSLRELAVVFEAIETVAPKRKRKLQRA